MKNTSRILVILVVAVTCLVIQNISFAAQEQPSGTVSISSTSVAIGFGVNWGHGTLNFNGKEYKFKINGLSVVDLGVSSVEVTGEVYHLQHLSDFAGNYVAASAGIDAVKGAGATAMENEHDVVLILKSVKQGVQFTLAVGGARVKLLE
jgi:hypothetical protein